MPFSLKEKAVAMEEKFERYRKLLKKRKSYDPSIDVDWDADPVIAEMVDIMADDVDDTVEFLASCTGDEFSWLSEIFDEIVIRTQSRKLVDALYETARRFPDECEADGIMSFIDEARDRLQSAKAGNTRNESALE